MPEVHVRFPLRSADDAVAYAPELREHAGHHLCKDIERFPVGRHLREELVGEYVCGCLVARRVGVGQLVAEIVIDRTADVCRHSAIGHCRGHHIAEITLYFLSVTRLLCVICGQIEL